MASNKIEITLPPAIKKGQVFPVAVRLDHPMDSGLRRDLTTGKKLPLFFVETMEVHYGGKKVSWMELSPGVSQPPIIKFMLNAGQGGPLRIKIKNNKGQEFENQVNVKTN
jgi:sulfur-oxidizing protein SoxZ